MRLRLLSKRFEEIVIRTMQRCRGQPISQETLEKHLRKQRVNDPQRIIDLALKEGLIWTPKKGSYKLIKV